MFEVKDMKHGNIAIYIKQEVKEILERDVIMFETSSKNNGFNMNDYISKIIIGYHDEYYMKKQNAFNDIEETLRKYIKEKETRMDIAEDITENVLYKTEKKKRGTNSVRITLKPRADTNFLLQDIEEKVSQTISVSQYFARMLTDYVSLSFEKRERIIFKEKYDAIQQAIEKNNDVSFRVTRNDTSTLHVVTPYRLIRSNEEMFLYLVCQEWSEIKKKFVVMSYHLKYLQNVQQEGASRGFDEEVERHLRETCENAPQFAINDNQQIRIKVDDEGIEQLKRIYTHRPRKYKLDGNILTTECSENQAFVYFSRFGSTIEVLEPESLRKRMINYYSKAIKTYEFSK